MSNHAMYELIATAAAVVAVIVAIAIAIYQRRRKVLEYHFFSSSLAKVPGRNYDRMKILFDGKEVRRVFHQTVWVENRGNVAVAPPDYVEPMEISVADDEAILDARCGIWPDDAALILLEPKGNRVLLPPILINPGEVLAVSVVTTFEGSMKIRARIVEGIIRPARDSRTEKLNPWILPFAILLFALSLFWIPRSNLRAIDLAHMGVALLGAFTLGFAAFFHLRVVFRRRRN